MEIIQKIKSLLFPSTKRTVISLVIIGGIIFYAWRTFFPATPPVQYQTDTVIKGTLVSSVAESGQVAVSNRASITTQASGAISQVYVKDGDTVTQGQKIADVILDGVGQQRQAAAWSSYLSAQNTLATAQNKLNSLQSTMFKTNQSFVNDKGVFDPSDTQKADPKYIEENADWLAAEADYKNQTAVIAQTQTALSSSWLAYQAASATITAPIDGVVSDLTITPGLQIGSANTTASAGSGASAQVIGSVKTNGKPVVSVSISEIDAVKVKTGDKATVTFDALPNKTFTGKVAGINTMGIVSSGVTTYPTTILLDLPNDQILPNMSATANIVTSIKDNVLLVPLAAVQTSAGQSTVRVMQNGVPTSTPVVVGDSSDTQTEIVSGLTEGQTVVIGVISTQTATSTSGASPFSRNIFGGGGGAGR